MSFKQSNKRISKREKNENTAADKVTHISGL